MKNNRGVTLVALVVTVIILLIIAGISIGTITNSFEKTENAKLEAEIKNEREIVLQAGYNAMQANKWGEIELEELIKQLEEYGLTEDDVSDTGDEFEIIFPDPDDPDSPGRGYKLSKKGDIEDIPADELATNKMIISASPESGIGEKYTNQSGETKYKVTISQWLRQGDGTLQYAWNESRDSQPSSFNSLTTTATENNKKSGNVDLPETTGTYYLWVKGTGDNVDTQTKCFGPYTVGGVTEYRLAIVVPEPGRYDGETTRYGTPDRTVVNLKDPIITGEYTVTFVDGESQEQVTVPQRVFDRWTLSGAGRLEGSQFTFGEDSSTVTAELVNSTVKLPTPSKDGYVFSGWNTEADGSGTEYTGGDNISITSNTTLYAQWEETDVLLAFTPTELTMYVGQEATASIDTENSKNYGALSILNAPEEGIATATLDQQTGTVTVHGNGFGEGVVTIVESNKGVTANINVTIQAKPAIYADSIILYAPKGEPVTIPVTGDNIGEISISEGPNENIATATLTTTEEGTFLTATPVAEGETSIKLIESSNVADEVTVPITVYQTAIVATPNPLILYEGGDSGEVSLTGTRIGECILSDEAGKQIDSQIATVDNDAILGNILTITPSSENAGETSVTVVETNGYSEATIDVRVLETSISVVPNEVVLYVGGSPENIVITGNENAGEFSIKDETETDNTVVRVDSSKINNAEGDKYVTLTPEGEGETYITIKENNGNKEVRVKITVIRTTITAAPEEITLYVDGDGNQILTDGENTGKVEFTVTPSENNIDIKTAPNNNMVATEINGKTITLTPASPLTPGNTSMVVEETPGGATCEVNIAVKQVNYSIDDTQYAETLEGAFELASSGSTIKLLNNYTDSSEPILDGKIVLFDNNGKTLTKSTKAIKINETARMDITGSGTIQGTDSINVIIDNAGTLNIMHTGTIKSDYTRCIENTGIINKTGNGTITSGAGWSTIGNSGSTSAKVTISAGTVSHTGTYQAIHSYDGAQVYIEGEAYVLANGNSGIALGHDTESGHAGSSLNMSGGKVESTSGTGITGGKVSENSSIVITGGEVKGATNGVVAEQATTRVTIGNQSDELNKTNPLITGGTYGLNMIAGTASFYNGILKGTTAGYTGTISEWRNGCIIVGNEETVEGVNYKTNYLLIPGDIPIYSPIEMSWVGDGKVHPIVEEENKEYYFTLGATYLLQNDIDMSSVCSASIGSWTPIGTTTERFTGKFYGNNHEIQNLYVSNSTESAVLGLFTCLDGATVKDLTLTGSVTTSEQADIGGFAGRSYGNTTIDNCHNKATVSSAGTTWSVGGIVGAESGGTLTITNSDNEGSISGAQSNGGLVAYIAGGTTLNITGSHNSGTIITNQYAGGILGRNASGTANISNCYNTANISGGSHLGGIAGPCNGTTKISNCYNTGNITSTRTTNSIGGILAEQLTLGSQSTVTSCENRGQISGSNNAGGIVGFAYTIVIDDCHNKGAVTNDLGIHAGGILARDNAETNTVTITNSSNEAAISGTATYIGGVAGRIFGVTNISDVENTGNVTNTQTNVTTALNIGGIVGFEQNTATLTITDCHNTATIKSNATTSGVNINVGGILGAGFTGTIQDCYNTGSITGGVWLGGIAGSVSTDGTFNIVNSYNTANITSTSIKNGSSNNCGRSAGILGMNWNNTASILNCYNKGTIQGNNYAGGIVAYAHGDTNVLNTYNQGNVTDTGNTIAGGIICYTPGDSTSATYTYKININTVYNKGTITSTNANIAASIIRVNKSNTANITNAYYLSTGPAATTGAGTINANNVVAKTDAQLKEAAMVQTLNTNKNNLNLNTYGLNAYTKNDWYKGVSNYPEFTGTEATSITANPKTLTLYVGGSNGTSTITTVNPGTVTVKSSNTGIATCSISGNTVTIVPKAEGNATITVSGNKGASDKITVTVKQTSLSIGNLSGTLYVGGTARTATVTTTNIPNNTQLEVATSNSNIATVSITKVSSNKATLTITPKTTAGTVTITVTEPALYGGKSATTKPTAALTSISIGSLSGTLYVGGVERTATVTTTNMPNNTTLTATSSDTSKATVEITKVSNNKATLTITPKTTAGTVTITVTEPTEMGGKSATTKPEVKATSVNNQTIKGYVGAGNRTATITGTNMGSLSIATAPNSSIATAKISGTTLTVTPKAAGNTSVVVKEANGNKTGTVTVKIAAKPTLSITGNTTIVSGNSVTYTATPSGTYDSVSYQWYYSTNSSAAAGTGTKGGTANTNKFSPTSTIYVSCTATFTYGNSVTVTSAKSTITVQTANYSITNGSTTKYYNTFAKAYADAVSGAADSAGGAIKLLNDYKDTSTMSVSKKIKFDTNGKTLTREATITVNSGYTFTIAGNGTIQTSSAINLFTNEGTLILAGNGTVKNTNTSKMNLRAISNKGTLKITGNTTVRSHCRVICSEQNTSASIEISNGNIAPSGTGLTEGFAIGGMSSGGLKITGGTISCANSAATIWWYGTGAINISGGTVSNSNSTKSSSLSDMSDGPKALMNDSNSSLTISSGTLKTTAGGWDAVQNCKDGTVTITGGTITGYHSAYRNRGNSNTTISGGTFTGTNNDAIVVHGSGTTTVSNVTATGRTAAYNYGSGTLTLVSGTYTSNGGEGWAVVLHPDSTGRINIGTNSTTFNTTNPNITGLTYGCVHGGKGKIYMYNGILKGKTSAWYNYTDGSTNPTGKLNVRSGYTIQQGTSGDYKTLYLKK